MRRIASIHVFEDEVLLRWMVRASLTVLGFGVLAGAGWWFATAAFNGAAGSQLAPFELDHALGSWGARALGLDARGVRIDRVWWLMLAGGVAASFAAHELVHAWLFRRFAPPGAHVTIGANLKMGMFYASAEGIAYSRSRYLLIVLAPSVAVSVAVVAIGVGLGWPLWTLIVATVHLSGCTGDWAYARAIRADAAIAYCRDTAWGVELYGDDRVGNGHAGSVTAGGKGDGRMDDDASATDAGALGGAGLGQAGASSRADGRLGFTVVDGGRSDGGAAGNQKGGDAQ